MRSTSVFVGSLAVLICAPASAAEPPSLPDPIMTPGAIDPAETREVACNSSTHGRRHVTAAMKAEVLAGTPPVSVNAVKITCDTAF